MSMVAARAAAGLVAAILFQTAAGAHHPGSHATDQGGGRVRIEAVATVTDTCTQIAEIRTGLPPGISAVPGGTPVTVRLRRPEGPCQTAVTAIRAAQTLDVKGAAGQIHLYVLAPDGSLASSERIPVR
jgi:hypothetical protein